MWRRGRELTVWISVQALLSFITSTPSQPKALTCHVEALVQVLPWTAPMLSAPVPTVFICRDFVCETPITHTAELEKALGRVVGR
jgi:hypothetical protein